MYTRSLCSLGCRFYLHFIGKTSTTFFAFCFVTFQFSDGKYVTLLCFSLITASHHFTKRKRIRCVCVGGVLSQQSMLSEPRHISSLWALGVRAVWPCVSHANRFCCSHKPFPSSFLLSSSFFLFLPLPVLPLPSCVSRFSFLFPHALVHTVRENSRVASEWNEQSKHIMGAAILLFTLQVVKLILLKYCLWVASCFIF